MVVVFCFCVLSLLPAVLLHLSLAGSFAPLVATGYCLSFSAMGMHLWELFHPGLHYQQRALLLITVGFGVLTTLAVVAVALLPNVPVWTEDRDFFGSGLATWTTDRVELYLQGRHG